MAIIYFDSSALVKPLVEEEGSELAAALWDGGDAAVSSRLAYPPRHEREAETSWDEFWSATRAVELTATVAQQAGERRLMPFAGAMPFTWPAPHPAPPG